MQSPVPTPNSINPFNGSKQRFKPKRILFGNWVRSGLHTGENSNAVYNSRDVLNRINRRIVNMDVAGHVVLGEIYNVWKTSCKHDDIDYFATFRNMTKQEMDAHIQPLLDAMETTGPSFLSSRAAERRCAGYYLPMQICNPYNLIFDFSNYCVLLESCTPSLCNCDYLPRDPQRRLPNSRRNFPKWARQRIRVTPVLQR